MFYIKTPKQITKTGRKRILAVGTEVKKLGLDDGDEIAGVRMTCGESQLFVATHNGMAIRMCESDIRPSSRSAHGVRAIKLREGDKCTEQYVICYDWKQRDTKETGTYKGIFEIVFDPSLKNDSYTYPSGILNMPIREELYIVIK